MKFKMNFGNLKRFKKRLAEEFGGHGDKLDAEKFMMDVVRTAGHRCLAKTIENTPKDTGQLRMNWEMGSITKSGFNYRVTMENPVEYASYIEYGHRQTVGRYVHQIGKRLVNDWVEGHFMATNASKETLEQLPEIVEEKMRNIAARLES